MQARPLGRALIPSPSDLNASRAGVRDFAEAAARIDAERRLLFVPGARRLFRAAAAYDAGLAMEHYRELGLSVADVAAELRMSDFEVRRLIVPPQAHLAREAARGFRLS